MLSCVALPPGSPSAGQPPGILHPNTIACVADYAILAGRLPAREECPFWSNQQAREVASKARKDAKEKWPSP